MRKPKNPPSNIGGHLAQGDRLLGVMEWGNPACGPLNLYYIWRSANDKYVAWESDSNRDRQRGVVTDLEARGWNKDFLKALLPFLRDYDDPSVSPNARPGGMG